MARPTSRYSRRNIRSYDRDKEYLMRLRNQIFLDTSLDSVKAEMACKKIDGLLRLLRDLAPSDAVA